MVRNNHMLSTYKSVDICIFITIKLIKHKQANSRHCIIYIKIINILKIFSVVRVHMNTGIFSDGRITCYTPFRKQFDSNSQKKKEGRVYKLSLGT